MPFKQNNPGCKCCFDDCLIDITGWNQVSGIWTITNSNKNLETGNTNALIVTTNEHPEGKSTHVVEVFVRGEDDGDILRVVVAYADSNNYLFAEVEVGATCGYLRLWQMTGGLAFQLGDDVPILDLAPAEDHAIKVCYDGENLTAILTGKASYLRPVTATGEYVGVATGAIITLATFKNFRWWIHYDDGGHYGEPNDCPLCKLPCTIYTDGFNRSDLGCTWSSQPVNWNIVSSILVAESSVNIQCLVPHPVEGGSQYVSVSCSGESDGDKVLVIVDYDDDTGNYHYAELEVGTNAKLSLYRYEGGSGTLLETKNITAAVGTRYTITVCIADAYFSASIGTDMVIADSGAFGGNYTGIGADLTASSSVSFYSFLFSRLYFGTGGDEDCPRCYQSITECEECQDGDIASYILVKFDFANMTRDPPCPDDPDPACNCTSSFSMIMGPAVGAPTCYWRAREIDGNVPFPMCDQWPEPDPRHNEGIITVTVARSALVLTWRQIIYFDGVGSFFYTYVTWRWRKVFQEADLTPDGYVDCLNLDFTLDSWDWSVNNNEPYVSQTCPTCNHEGTTVRVIAV